MKAWAGLAILAVAGCSEIGSSVSEDSLGYDAWSTEVRRAVAAAYLEQPFADGTVYVVAEERGEMKTYILVPCRGGTHICGETLRGRAGHLSQQPDFAVVTGAYSGRTFFLSPGGSGVLRRGGVDTALAWD